MRFTKRNLLIYFAAWIPYAASYTAVFAYQGFENFAGSVSTMLMNVVPAAIVGLGAIRFCSGLKWSQIRRERFLLIQFAAALAYSLLWYAFVIAVFTVELSIRRGRFSPTAFSGYALQWQLFSGVMIYATIASVVYAAQIAENLRVEEQRRARAEKRAHEIEAAHLNQQLAALRAQLNPHFLFNTLHSLMALVRYEPSRAEDALETLAEMLRYVLRDKRESGGEKANLVALGDELKFVENYLALEKMRLGERLTVVKTVDRRALDCLLPAFTLQPIIENAIKHGIAPRARIGTVRIKAEIRGDELLLEVADDGAGARFEQTVESNNLGLRLVREQLALHYNGDSDFAIETAENAGFAARIRLPIEKAKTTKATTEIESSRAYH